MKNYRFATLFVSLFLVVYTILYVTGAPGQLLALMFILSPVLVCWLVYTVLRFAHYTGKVWEEEIPDEALRG